MRVLSHITGSILFSRPQITQIEFNAPGIQLPSLTKAAWRMTLKRICSMRHSILATCLAAALALSPFAAPKAKAADFEDAIGLLILLGAAAVAVDALDGNDSAKKTTTTRRTGTYRSYEPERDWRSPYDAAPRYQKRTPHWSNSRHNRGKVIPGRCLRSYDTRRGEVRAYSERCLQRYMRNAQFLPQSCERSVRTDRGRADIYLPRCLKREGWKVEARYRGN